MDHWHSDENSLKHFHLTSWLVENTSVICIQMEACFCNYWGRSSTYNRKVSGPRKEPLGTLYFNVINTNQKLEGYD